MQNYNSNIQKKARKCVLDSTTEQSSSQGVPCQAQAPREVVQPPSAETNCHPDRKSKMFVEALTRVGCKGNSEQDLKTYKRQVRRNEALKDQINREKGLSAGAVFEAQNVSLKIELQSQLLKELSEQICSKHSEVYDLQKELGSASATAANKEAEIKQELKELRRDELKLNEEQKKFNEQEHLKDGAENMDFLKDHIESNIDEMIDEMNRRKYKNVEYTLKIDLLECEKKHLQEELREYETRDQKGEEQMRKLNRSLQQYSSDINKSKQTLKQQQLKLQQLADSICSSSAANRDVQTSLVVSRQQQKEAQTAQEALCEKLKEEKTANESQRTCNAQLRGQVANLRRLLQQEVLVKQDAFGMQC